MLRVGSHDTRLHEAALLKSEAEIAKLAGEIPFDTKDEDGKTALDLAVENFKPYAVIALLASNKRTDKTPLWASLNNIGQRFFSSEKYEEALVLHHQARDIATRSIRDEKKSLLISIQALAACCFHLGRNREERVYLREEFEILDTSTGENYVRSVCLFQEIGSSYIRDGYYADAYRQFFEARNSLKWYAHGTLAEVKLLNQMGNCLSKQNKFADANGLHKEALNILRTRVQDDTMLVETLEAIAFSCENLGDYKQANEYSTQACRLQQKILESASL